MSWIWILYDQPNRIEKNVQIKQYFAIYNMNM